MMRFLETLNLTESAREGIAELIFGRLTPDDAIDFNNYLEKLTEEELMLITLRNIQ